MNIIIIATKVPTTVDTITPFGMLLVCCPLASQLLAISHKFGLPLASVTARRPSGSTPQRLLYETSRLSSGNQLRMDGIFSVRALYERSRTMGLLSSPSLLEISRVNKFIERSNVLSCEQFPSVGDIPPMKAFWLKSSQFN